MYKFSATNDWSFGIDPVCIITDAKSLIKRASAKDFLKYAKTKGQTDLHIIAVGAYEGTGFNRNGDMFKEAFCRANHHFFKQADRAVHRHHKNKPEDPKYGNIKAAAYNEPMRRIELIVGLDDDKCGDILGEQEKVGHTNWSMASKQAHDICTWCHHKAASDDERCEHIPNKIGEINKQGEMCGMDNPDPRWFEISYVRRPADRIGMSLSKVASSATAMLPRDYLQIYTGFVPPSDDLFVSKKASDKRVLVRKAAAIEKHLDAVSTEANKKINGEVKLQTEKIAFDVMDELRQLEPGRFFKLAADKNIILSPENFTAYVFGGRVKEASVIGMKKHLRGIFQAIEKEGGDVVNNETYEPSRFVIGSQTTNRLFSKLASAHSLHPAFIVGRLSIVKTAEQHIEDDPISFELAKQYIAYKLAALNYLSENNRLTDDIIFNGVIQNRN